MMDWSDIGWKLVFGVTIFLVVLIVTIPASTQEKTIEGKVIDYTIYDDYVVLEFDNGEIIKTKYGEYGTVNDLTVNSTLIVKFQNQGAFFILDDIWVIKSITKLPEKPLT